MSDHKGEFPLQLFITAAPNEMQQAGAYGRPLAHMAYRIGEDSSLLRQNLLLQTRGGLLGISDQKAPVVKDPVALSQAVLRECGRRSYTGVLLDFESVDRPDLSAFVSHLSQALLSGRRALFVPEAYAGNNRIVLVNTAISGGTFTECLREASARYGSPSQIALDLQRLQMDFSLPAPTGEGRPLSNEEFHALIDQQSPSTFFSQELCAHYFTYSTEQVAHFVLFDNTGSMRQKLRIGTGLGFAAAFLQWPEIADLAPSLFGQT